MQAQSPKPLSGHRAGRGRGSTVRAPALIFVAAFLFAIGVALLFEISWNRVVEICAGIVALFASGLVVYVFRNRSDKSASEIESEAAEELARQLSEKDESHLSQMTRERDRTLSFMNEGV